MFRQEGDRALKRFLCQHCCVHNFLKGHVNRGGCPLWVESRHSYQALAIAESEPQPLRQAGQSAW